MIISENNAGIGVLQKFLEKCDHDYNPIALLCNLEINDYAAFRLESSAFIQHVKNGCMKCHDHEERAERMLAAAIQWHKIFKAHKDEPQKPGKMNNEHHKIL